MDVLDDVVSYLVTVSHFATVNSNSFAYKQHECLRMLGGRLDFLRNYLTDLLTQWRTITLANPLKYFYYVW